MSMNTNITIATNGRIKKSKQAWAQLRQTFINKQEIEPMQRLILLPALIGSIWLYISYIHSIIHEYSNMPPD